MHLLTMSESLVTRTITTSIPDDVSQLQCNGTHTHRVERFVNYNVAVIGFIVIMASFVIIGIPSNLLLVIVFRQRQKRHYGTNNLFALSLAVTDAIICCFAIPLQTVTLLGMIRTKLGCGTAVFISHTTVSFQVILILGVCIERYCAVCRPFQRWRVKHVIVFVGSALIFSGSISAVAFPTAVFDDTSIYFCERKASLARYIMDGLDAFCWFAIVIIVTVLYTITIVKICKRTRMKRRVRDASLVRNVTVHRNEICDVIA